MAAQTFIFEAMAPEEQINSLWLDPVDPATCDGEDPGTGSTALSARANQHSKSRGRECVNRALGSQRHAQIRALERNALSGATGGL